MRPERAQMYQALIQPVLDSLPKEGSKITYRSIACLFFNSPFEFSADGIGRYLARLKDRAKESTIRLHKSVLFRLAREAETQGSMQHSEVAKIYELELPESASARNGFELSKKQVWKLVSMVKETTLEEKRNGAVLALLLGHGLTATEACDLTWEKWEELYPRAHPWAVRVTVAWKAELAALERCEAVDFKRFHALQRFARGPKAKECRRLGGKLSENGVRWIVAKFGKRLGVELTPKDLRRAWKNFFRNEVVEK